MAEVRMEQNNTVEVKIGTTTFVVSRRYSGTGSLEEVLKTAIKRRIEAEGSFATPQSEAMETRYKT
jgi:hypothetical protein